MLQCGFQPQNPILSSISFPDIRFHRPDAMSGCVRNVRSPENGPSPTTVTAEHGRSASPKLCEIQGPPPPETHTAADVCTTGEINTTVSVPPFHGQFRTPQEY
ncbi:hypothetical protein CEXT_565011 [Caerostris extrusa]|uniref:Uncharacterized protein n=1 Tax=Caerostris extrusa TaxID=172846 RepID=A0AAV4RLV3_CAEEX|nr:hypothetical protein CEXT_565011 [Caerostris extrusa]